MTILRLLTLISLCVMTTYSCTQFEDIGSDLVDGDEIQVITDTEVPYELQTYERDSLLAYSRSGSPADFVPTTHILGQLDDPVFGHTRYDLTAQVQFSESSLDFTGATFDSAFLLLSYDTTFSPYGATEEMQTLDVYELDNRDLPEKIYVNDNFTTKTGTIGSHTFLPSYKNQNRGDSLSAPSHIRIPMTREFGERILALDTAVTSSVLEFLDVFPGFVIRPREGNFNGAYRFFAYATNTASGQTSNSAVSPYSGIRIFYTQDGDPKEAYLRMRPVLHHFTTVAHDEAGSSLGEALANDPVVPEYLYIQPTNVGTRIHFTDLSQYQGKVINDVSLTWSVAGHPQDDTSVYQPMPAIFALEEEELSERVPVTDILLNQSGGAYRQFFGGVIQENDDPGSQEIYTFNITHQFQRIVDGSADPYVYIVPTPQDISRIARSVIYGPGIEDEALKPRIKITYSSTNN